MRVFFGLETEPASALAIGDWRDRQLHAGGRPVPPANFHITLAFVGEIGERALESLCDSADAWLDNAPCAAGCLRLDTAGYWPRPGIYWLGPATWPHTLGAAAQKLRHLATAAGARRDRNPFRPHVTLFRNCDQPPPAPAREPGIDFAYDRITLFESRRGRQGVGYHPLADWPLAGGPTG